MRKLDSEQMRALNEARAAAGGILASYEGFSKKYGNHKIRNCQVLCDLGLMKALDGGAPAGCVKYKITKKGLAQVGNVVE